MTPLVKFLTLLDMHVDFRFTEPLKKLELHREHVKVTPPLSVECTSPSRILPGSKKRLAGFEENISVMVAFYTGDMSPLASPGEPPDTLEREAISSVKL